MAIDHFESARSVHGGIVRLTKDRWSHIVEGHSELAGMRDAVLKTVAHPRKVLAGQENARMAIDEIESGKWLVVVYREINGDGFVITAFLTRRLQSLNRRDQLWPVA